MLVFSSQGYKSVLFWTAVVLFWDGTSSTVENNTVVRVLPKNSVTDVVFTFKKPGNIIRNNIFVVSSKWQVFSDNGTEVYKTANYSGQERLNNIYFSADGSQPDPCGLPLGPGEKIADPRFVDFEKRNYRLKPDSPAIDTGFNSGSATDLDGRKVPTGKGRDIGAFEFATK
ncbi:MAG: choice-of-anchor Q domain-containing protein [Rhodospirillales bacterium]